MLAFVIAFVINYVNTGCLSVCVTPYQYNYYPITDLLYCVLLHYPGKGQYPQNRRYCNVDKAVYFMLCYFVREHGKITFSRMDNTAKFYSSIILQKTIVRN